MAKKEILYIVILLLSFFYMFPNVSAFWLMWLNCEDLANGIVTPQLNFMVTEPVCFYGGDFVGETATITLRNNNTKKNRFLTVTAVDGKVSSIEGYYFPNLEKGQYIYPADCNDLKGCRNQDGKYECIQSDKSCQLVRYNGPSENCVEDTSKIEKDTDDDGWSDSCDAIPDDPLERMDWDLDGIGNDNDVKDFDRKIKVMKDPNRKKPQKKNDTQPGVPGDGGGGVPGDGGGDGGVPGNGGGDGGVPGDGGGDGGVPGDGGGGGGSGGGGSGGGGSGGGGSGGGGSGGGGSGGGGSGGGGTNPIFTNKECTPVYECDYWSECINRIQTRECQIINGCTIENNPPALEQSCESGTTVLASNPQAPDSTPNEGFAAITGAAIRDIGKSVNAKNVLFTVIIIIICIVFALTYYRNVKKRGTT